MTSPNFSKRADALDALRGFAVLTMVLSGTIAYKILPPWMYHGQEPPPTHAFNPDLAGFTWVDWVFPLFLFSMGAAIPLALSRKIAQGWDERKIILSIITRGFFLGSFAIILQHLRPFQLNSNPTPQTWWTAFAGFFIIFCMYVRLPKSWFPWLQKSLTLVAWSLCIVIIANWQYPKGTGFDLNRSDIILIVLTNIAVFGSIIWLFTRSQLWLRLGFLGLLLAMRLSSTDDGLIKLIWNQSPVPWIFQFDYLKYLFIAIPGTIIGDLICSWLESPDRKDETDFNWKQQQFYLMILLSFTMILILLIGLQGRWVWQTTLLTGGIGLSGLMLCKNPTTGTELLLSQLYKWGFFWLFLGLLFEPYQGGIKKDSATYSYFFVTTGMAILLLIAFAIIIDVFKKRGWMALLIDNGMNPLIGYMGFANLIWPILGLNDWEKPIIDITSTPVTGFLRGVFYTLIVASIASLLTRLKLFLRT
ncbi:DUF5009 domain-containing protein [Limnofasciculus baicalensis]|uniref:DUF5009 domain-containing protein n=1 Tax=Limnofasciculus baicalensis BBK-W-15 TaxID=2699891 RepID=A0AAE3GWU4_9CYAN|nr:DUF5009 domain-containing protein [Limnofasciculus baicalensis]MCP2732155.1 DUF5009 domain-containing protein [Limnofasciculus baicalensis BBK-W-15]